MVWQNPKRSYIFMIEDAKVEVVASVTGSKIQKEHIPQQPMRKEVEPLKPQCAPLE
jgi:hypothetical protein